MSDLIRAAMAHFPATRPATPPGAASPADLRAVLSEARLDVSDALADLDSGHHGSARRSIECAIEALQTALTKL